MNLEFKSQKELYERVRPALYAKKAELRRAGYYNIKEYDIWKYLAKYKWKNSKNLMLSDIVNDILNTDNNKLYEYYKNIDD